jgi:hypothetical protein
LLHQKQLIVLQAAAVAVGNTPEVAVAVPPAAVDRIAVHEEVSE